MSDIADLLQSKPGPDEGWPTGYGDWRIAVQMVLPSEFAAYWDLSYWDIDHWSELPMQDVTPYVRGAQWVRGADDFGGRPSVGVGQITLNNLGHRFSAVDPTNSFGTNVATAGFGHPITNYYFGPGTVVRIVAWSPSDDSADGLVQQITGVVESWPESWMSKDRESFVEVTFVETISRLARIDINALPNVVGNDDTCTERVERLADAAGWRYGYLHAEVGTGYDDWPLQSTDMANNRLGEVYLTVDSVGAVARTDRSGALLTYATAPTKGPNPAPAFYLAADAGALDAHAVYADPTRVVWDNDTEPIINFVQMARVGGEVQTALDQPSIDQHDPITWGRNDLINKSDTLTLALAESKINTGTLRLRELHVDGDADPRAIGALISVDVGNTVDAYAAATDGNLIAVTAQVDGMEHQITPTHEAGPVRWTGTYRLGIQDEPTYQEAAP